MFERLFGIEDKKPEYISRSFTLGAWGLAQE